MWRPHTSAPASGRPVSPARDPPTCPASACSAGTSWRTTRRNSDGTTRHHTRGSDRAAHQTRPTFRRLDTTLTWLFSIQMVTESASPAAPLAWPVLPECDGVMPHRPFRANQKTLIRGRIGVGVSGPPCRSGQPTPAHETVPGLGKHYASVPSVAPTWPSGE